MGRLGGLLVANMAPTRPPKLSKNPLKICIQIGQFFDIPWEGYILRYWWIFDANMELKWLPNGVNFRYGLPNTDLVEFADTLKDFIDFLGLGGLSLEAKTITKSITK